ncbi:MAG: lipoyl(octanoyl) transferase LipB [Candidatus Sulfopaludibacter sp.]|nr:lipoyl(octanoyl) transferase LipB [Candidatus Sulfopaludibacter sp.]
MRNCCLRELGRIGYGEALELQQELIAARKAGQVRDQLLLLEHPHVITLGRNGHLENLLASDEILSRAGIAFYPTDRGGDVTYHGPGQLVGYPILDLKDWKRDVGAYVRGIEQTIIDTLAEFGIGAGRVPKLTGVWVDGRKIAAIGVHLSRWVTSHGFALNVNTDLSYFQYIVPCGLTKPVTSMAQLGVRVTLEEVSQILAVHFGRVFDCEMERENLHDRRSDAADGREHCRRDADQVAQEAR